MMKTTCTLLAAMVLLIVNTQLATVHAQGTVFTYQGQLNSGGSNYTGVAEIAPALWNAVSNGNQVGTNNPTSVLVGVTNGLFTIALDFGSGPFTAGAPRWLEFGVRTTLDSFTILSPRQPVTAVPYAITAGYVTTAGNAASFSGSLAGDVTGTQSATVIAKVGGQTATSVATGSVAANAATSANTANTIVMRDGSGNFTANAITAGSLSGNGAGLTSLSASNLTGTVPLTQLSGITSNQLDPATWQFLVNLARGPLPAPTGMVLIPAGAFTMGDTLDGESDAVPVTNVYVSAFYMDTNLVSYALWTNIYSYAINHGYTFVNAGAGKAYNHPVQSVNWYDCVAWCNARSQQAGLTPVYYTDVGLTQIYTYGEVTVYPNWSAKGYRLPTEAEWEKAARGGNGQRFSWGNTISESQANYYAYPNPPNSSGFAYDLGPYSGFNTNFATGGFPYTSPVGSFAPNGYGLYDMVGNAIEWCWDCYGTPYAGGANPQGPSGGVYRVLRGGSWSLNANLCRSAARFSNVPTNSNNYPSFGFRSVLPAGQ